MVNVSRPGVVPYRAAEAVLRWRCAGFAERVAIFFQERRASLTASESGKASKRSGAIKTMLVPSCMRLQCLPRTPLLKSSDGRGARGSSSLAFFILFYLSKPLEHHPQFYAEASTIVSRALGGIVRKIILRSSSSN